MKPYKEKKFGNIIRRTFSHLVESEELVWHRDREDRIVIPLNENDWMVQFDNELPRKLNINEEFFIPKNTFHRVIKGSGDLMVEIIETDFEDDEFVIYETIEEGKKKKGKKDACYHKVRARYDVWPSAYASGALVKCRKVGAANWGNKSNESEEPIEEKWSEKYKKSIDCSNPKGFSQRAHCQGRKKRNESIEDREKFSKEMIKKAHYAITRRKGKDYAPDVHELQAWIDNYLQTTNVIKEQLNLLNEITSDEAYEKFYKNLFNKDKPELDRQIYNTIIQLDPTFRKEKNKLGEYTKWLFRKDNVEILKKTKEEDLYKIKDDLEFYNKAKTKNILPSDKKDINKFNLESLLDFVFSFNKDDESLMSKGEKEREIKKDIKKYDLPNWTVIIPETQEASCYYGKGTKWCTAAEYNNMFNRYASEGDLYILISKDDPSEKYQFHFERSQFMDVKDRDIDLGEFMDENNDVYEFFSKIKGDDLDFQISKSCLERGNTDCFENFYTKKFTDSQKEELLRAAFSADENSDSYNTVSMVLNYIDYPEMKNDFRRDFIWGIERSIGNRYDEENYDARMFIDAIGGFTDDNIEDIVKAVDLKDLDEVVKLFEIAEAFDSVKILTNYLESEEIDINFDLIKTLDELKPKFNYDDYRKTYESNLAKIKIHRYNLEDGTVEVTITPKDENGNLITDKEERGFIDYKNMVNYLTMRSLFNEAKKTDFSKEKKQGLHGWFARQGGKGKSKGWVDCNTCRKDPETGRKKCKSCGRKEGEKRAKYPACRPTPSACGTPKKGKSWGKKSNENLSKDKNLSIFENKITIKNILRETFNQDDTMAEPMTQPAPVKPKEAPSKPSTEPIIQPKRKDRPFLPMPNTQPDPKAIKEGKFDFETYHKTLSSALDAARNYSVARGYDEVEFNMNDVQHVPYGHTERFSKELTKSGIPQRKALHVQIYRMESGNYELNMYIN